MKEFRCVICDGTEWEDVDKFRDKPEGMCMCKKCGFISYPKLYKTEEEIKQYYRQDYRNGNKPPSIQSLYSGQKKLNYHAKFLDEVFQKWDDEKIDPVVSEIGAAYGIFLGWLRSIFPKADVNGTELTTAFRRCAYHEHKIYLDEDFDETKKYDMIASYKVAEHQMDIDKYLIKYKECLKEGGYLYISVPCWFDKLHNFGTGGFNLKYYYHTNHINVWTRKLFETLLKKCGLKIIKEDHVMYGDTYLCKRDDSLMKETPKHEDPKKVLDWLESVHKAATAYDKGDFLEAVKCWPKFPIAHRGFYEKNRKSFHKDGFEEIEKKVLNETMKMCPDDIETHILIADIYMRYDREDNALELLEKALELDPNSAQVLHMMGTCFRMKAGKQKDPNESVKLIIEAAKITDHIRKTSMAAMPDSYNWLMKDFSEIPLPEKK